MSATNETDHSTEAALGTEVGLQSSATAGAEGVVEHEAGSIDISLSPEVLFHIGPLPVTNSMLAAYSVSIFLIILIFVITRRLQTVPGKLQLFLETIIVGAYDFVQNTTHNHKLTDWFFPVFMTLILFFWTANMANFLPGLLAIEYHDMHLYRPALADYALVVGAALGVFFFSQFTIVRFIGVKIYLKKYLNFSSPVNFFVGLLELVGDLARILSLSFRLFGNIFSEEVLMIVMLSLAPFLAPLPFAMLGLLTSTIQALLFPMLVLLFLNIAIEEGEHAKQATVAKQLQPALQPST